MKSGSIRAVLAALRDHRVRYLIAGGLAVNAHGFLRFTRDADLVIELASENIHATFTALAALGYQPTISVTADQFASSENRERWIREKGMRVLQFWSDQHRQTPIDVFVDVPFDFATELASAPVKELRGVGPIPIVTLGTLLAMKRAANREQDRIDLENLRLLNPDEHVPNA
jgi:hypothetical protein